MTEAKKKILIVEDHPIFRWGLSELIKEKLNLKHANELVRHAVHWEKTGTQPDGAPSR